MDLVQDFAIYDMKVELVLREGMGNYSRLSIKVY